MFLDPFIIFFLYCILKLIGSPLSYDLNACGNQKFDLMLLNALTVFFVAVCKRQLIKLGKDIQVHMTG